MRNIFIKLIKQIIKFSFQILFIFTFFLILGFLNKAHAQQVALSISPPILTSYMQPGKSILIAYTIANSGDPTIMSTKVRSFEARDFNGNIHIKEVLEGPVQFSLDNSYIQLGQSFFMDTQQKQQILLRIKVPPEASEGDYYYTLLAETQPPPTLEGVSSSKAKATIGSNILITVTKTGRIIINAKVSLFDILARHTLNLFGKQIKIIDSSDPVPVILLVSNQSKNFVTPEGEIIMKGNFGEKATYSIIPQNILAESQRMLVTNQSKPPCEGKTNLPSYCKQPISVFITGFFIGIYNLSTTIRFGDNSPTIFASTMFVAIPIKIIFGALIALCIILIIIARMKED